MLVVLFVIDTAPHLVKMSHEIGRLCKWVGIIVIAVIIVVDQAPNRRRGRHWDGSVGWNGTMDGKILWDNPMRRR